MPLILTADWHLTDKPSDAYRWRVFAALQRLLDKFGQCSVFHLGDLADKKDRHAGDFVNEVADRLLELSAQMREMHIIMGNHDKPPQGQSVWNMLNERYSGGVFFHDVPCILAERRIMLLPFTERPDEAWATLDWGMVKAAFMHQPIDGARANNGTVVAGSAMPILPRSVKIWAGDIHTPQKVGRVRYVGAPHPVNFGDDYTCRMLVVDENTFEIIHEEILPQDVKTLLSITSVDDLKSLELEAGAQVKIRLVLSQDQMQTFAAQERQLTEWAERAGVHLAAVETRVADGVADRQSLEKELSPMLRFKAFAAHEKLAADLTAVGQELLDLAHDAAH